MKSFIQYKCLTQCFRAVQTRHAFFSFFPQKCERNSQKWLWHGMIKTNKINILIVAALSGPYMQPGRKKERTEIIACASIIHSNMHMTIKYTSQDITHNVRLIFHGTAVTKCLHILSDNCTGGKAGLLQRTSLQCHFSSRLRSQCTGSGSFLSTRLQLHYVESDLWPPANTDIINMFEVRETRL